MSDRSFYHGYGIRIQDSLDFEEIQQKIPYPGPVFYLSAGDYDADMNWIFISQEADPEIKSGHYVKIDPYQATDAGYPEWDWLLVDTAQRLGLEILDGPAWFFVPDYS